MKHKKKWISAVAMLLALVLAVSGVGRALPTPVQAASISDLENQLAELENQKAEIDDEIGRLRDEISNITGEMEKIVAQKNLIDQEINLLNQKITITNQEITALSLLIADKQDALDAANEKLAKLQEENKQRIRAMEKNGKFSYWAVLANASTFFEFLDRIYLINEIRAEDERRLQEMKDLTQEIADARDALQSQQGELSATRQEQDAMQAELEVKRAEADELLIKLKADADAFQKLMDESEAKQDALMDKIAQKNEEIDDAKYQQWLAGQSGEWRIPCDYWVITSPYGPRIHPITGEVGKMHNGVDLAGPYGIPVYAARAGYVSYCGYEAGGAGWYVSLGHSGGFGSIYMHLDHYVVYIGQTIEKGQIIGYLGSSGGSTGPHLHFGIHKSGEGWVNPALYVPLY